MKQRPIIFKDEMVRAIFNGDKTQTRRIMKAQPILNDNFWTVYGAGWSKDVTKVPAVAGHSLASNCPYGQVGDQLWVRQAWMPDAPMDGTWDDIGFYGCKNAPLSLIPEKYRNSKHCLFRAFWTGTQLVGWKPSIHMPRWASHITLEITNIRIERLNDISESDAWQEGIGFMRNIPDIDETLTAKELFECLWESINGNDSWHINPWVWVIEFKQVGKGA